MPRGKPRNAEGEQRHSLAMQDQPWHPGQQRPAHQRDEPGRTYAMRLLDVDVRFRVDARGVEVLELVPV